MVLDWASIKEHTRVSLLHFLQEYLISSEMEGPCLMSAVVKDRALLVGSEIPGVG